MNNAGDVAGFYYENDGAHAFLFRNGKIQDLGLIGAGDHFAVSLNAAGQVVGFSQLSNHNEAFIFDGEFKHLGVLGGEDSYATGINARGEVVGFVETLARLF